MWHWFTSKLGRKRSRSATTSDVVREQRRNNFWHHLSSENDIVIVFVHGLLSDSKACWTAEDGTFWPNILKEDEIFERAAIYLGGYYTDVDSGEYNISQCAEELFRALEFSPGSERSPLDFKNIMFVCHSLGGIVTRRLIETHSSRFKEKRLGIVLMASPTLGSDYGKFLSALAKLYDHKVGLALKTGSQELADIDNRFRRLLDSNEIPYLYGAEAAEHKALLAPKYLPKYFNRVVGSDSASRYFGNLKILPGTNHKTIVKPNFDEHHSHLFLSHFFKTRYLPNTEAERYAASRTNGISSSTAHQSSNATDALFDIYEASCESYYLIRDVDEEFVRKLELSSVWITGPSASGKTSLVRRFLRNARRAPVEVTLSHCGSHPTEEYCLAEILDTASAERFEGKITNTRTFTELVDVLSARALNHDIVLFIDEVPVDRSDLTLIQPFVKFLDDLLDSIKKRVGKNVRFIICSIERPKISTNHQKFLGQLSFIHLLPWTKDELRNLLDLISHYLPRVRLPDLVAEQAIVSSEGSPRFLKRYLSQLLISDQEDATTRLQILHETTEHFRAVL